MPMTIPGAARTRGRLTASFMAIYKTNFIQLLQEIAAQHWLRFHDTQAPWAPPLLRAVCKLLNDAVPPVFCAATPMVLDSRACQPGLTGRHRRRRIGRRYARTLEIRDFEARHAHHELVSRFLPPALEAMRDTLRTVVRSCRWCDLSGAPSAFRDILIDFLDSLTVLDNFQLHNGDERAVDVSLTRLSGLRTLKVTPPRSPTAPLPPALDAAPARRRRLRAHLHHPQIWVTDLTVRGGVGDPLLAYLESYTGLQRLTLGYPHAESSHTPADAVRTDRFFRSVLVQHAASLRLLRCVSSAAGRWSFGAHNAEAIVKLQALEELEMSVNSADVRDDAPSNAVELFIDVAAKLPVLRTVSLVPNKRSSSSVAFMHHAHSDKARVKGKTDSVLAKYGQTVDSVAVARWMETRRGYDAGLKPEVGGVAAAWGVVWPWREMVGCDLPM
ncbi:hypothetical protein C8R44DRAFT_860954 [Mycena epipterygia]|nr:hypothetical protein C8R44DRAFT_860954 [Mycena epipterygia]